jgi:citrate/tricarballylate utilization protein
MRLDELMKRGEHAMTVCNACRYCEAYCPVFDAMEDRLTFAKADLTYLANLCHNCGECLYACQYAPPHEFGIDVPRTLAEIRLAAYEECCWPGALAKAYRRTGLLAALGVSIASMAVMWGASALAGSSAGLTSAGDFYAIIPHHVIVALFTVVAVFALVAISIGCRRFWTEVAAGQPPASIAAAVRACKDVLTLTHLHPGGVDCTHAEEARTPWRRWAHHLTFYGFALCFASTTVAAIYHVVFGWRAPYGYTSLPVILGTAGGLGLLAGPAALLALRRVRDPALTDPAQQELDVTFAALLLVTSVTGLLLLVLRDRSFMAPLLVIHLGFVLGLLATLPYGKFVHGVYRTAALLKYAVEHTRRNGQPDAKE